MKFCKDCDYFRYYSNTCAAPNNTTISKVTGDLIYKKEPENYKCYLLREDETSCGPDAKWFKEKEIKKEEEAKSWFQRIFR